jgi:hypothetical protein
MGFIPISIEKYIKMHLKNNPSANKKELRKRLYSSLEDYKNNIKCSCGNDIWVVGSASVGRSCFSCITGENSPNEDYEIDAAIKKSGDKRGRKHIDDMDPTKISGFFDDDGYEINSDLIIKPSLCIICSKDDDPNEEMLCNMNRFDQIDEKEFKCFAFQKR